MLGFTLLYCIYVKYNFVLECVADPLTYKFHIKVLIRAIPLERLAKYENRALKNLDDLNSG